MKILYDYQIFAWQEYGGISRYFYELINKFDSVKDIETNTPLLLSNNHYISDKKYVTYFNFMLNKQFRGKVRLLNLFNKPYSILKLKQQKFDIFHPTYYDPYFLKFIGEKPFILTVHDMIHEKFSEMFFPNDGTTEQKRLLVEKATKIIAVSESTKKDLIELFGTDKSKIKVVYHGNSMFPKSDIKLSFDIPKKYLLFIGGRSLYKNFERFIKSISELLNQDNELFVLCTGGGMFSDSETKLLSELSISKQVLQYNLDNDSLTYFYKNALAFIFPSLYEGFGIPILESFACNCPLVCSDVSSFPEVAADAACYFNPYDEASIKDAVLKVLQDKSFRKNLITKGRERLKLFSWEKTAIRTKQIYESVLT